MFEESDDHDIPSSRFEKALMLQNMLVDQCTGSSIDESLYLGLRQEFISDSSLNHLLPQFVRTNRSTGALWGHFKSVSPKWQPRREYVWREFSPLLDYLEHEEEIIVPTGESSPMFNLLVSGIEGAWDGSPLVLERSRFLIFTPDPIAKQFESLSDAALEKLLSLPTLFAYEQARKAPAHLGRITKVLSRETKIRISYEAFDSPTIPAELLDELEWELGIENWEMNRTHWAVKEMDLMSVLSEAKIGTFEQFANLWPENLAATATQRSEPFYVHPEVFRVPPSPQEPNLVSVMMPFQPAFQPVYSVIQAACSDLDLQCLNANDVWNENEVIQDIFSLIYRSKIVICDFSDRNANVFYEAGIAHTLGRSVIPIVQNGEHVPFDLSHHRYVEYLNNDQGREALAKQITPRLRHLSGK